MNQMVGLGGLTQPSLISASPLRGMSLTLRSKTPTSLRCFCRAVTSPEGEMTKSFYRRTQRAQRKESGGAAILNCKWKKDSNTNDLELGTNGHELPRINLRPQRWLLIIQNEAGSGRIALDCLWAIGELGNWKSLRELRKLSRSRRRMPKRQQAVRSPRGTAYGSKCCRIHSGFLLQSTTAQTSTTPSSNV